MLQPKMKILKLPLWIFAVSAHAFVLQPSVNVTVLQNASAADDLWVEKGLDQFMEALSNEDKKRVDEEAKFQMTDKETDAAYHQKNVENGLKKADRKDQARRSFLAAWDTTHSEEVKNEEHLLATVSPFAATPTMAFDTKPVLHLLTESFTLPPSSSSTSQRQAVLEILSVRTSTAGIKSETSELHIAKLAMGPTFTVKDDSTSDSPRVKLQVTNMSKLHQLEEVSVGVTEMLEGPTAKAIPSTFKAKPKNKVTGAKNKKSKMLKVKKRKAVGKAKKTKKVKRLKQEWKLKPTTPSYFPYFEDHYCPSECSCYGRIVQCSDKDMGKIPYGIPYNSRYILLMNNHIDSIQVNLLSLYDSMEFLVLSNNRLTDASIKGAFEGIQRLKRLYVEQNLLQCVPTDLPANLEELRLDRNQISVMSDASFRRCPNLLILSLSNNSLGNKSSTIPPGVLLPLNKLRTLTLSYNQLASVPLQLPLGLRELYLRGNCIQRLHGEMFWGDTELQVLDLSLNRLTDKGLGKAALLNASHLESLNLEGNLLKKVPRHMPSTIKTLNLEGNLISSIPKDVFISMPQLEHLGLARNKITKVAPGAFRVLPLLHQLDLSYNILQQVPRQLPLWLHSATFANNKIRSIPHDAFCWGQGNESPLSRLVKVDLEYNMIALSHLNTSAFRCLRGFQVVQFY